VVVHARNNYLLPDRRGTTAMKVQLMLRRRSYGRLAAQCLLLLISVSCLGVYFGAYLVRKSSQFYDVWAFDQAVRQKASPHVAAPLPPRPVAKRTPALPAIGRILIPRLHLSAMVREGTDHWTLQLAVGHVPATALPGQPGNVGIAGHRDTFFHDLKHLKKSDRIDFLTLDGDFKNRVEEMMIVPPENTGVLEPSSENTLTLVSCYPFQYIGNAPKRFVVRARQIH
jgi:sortase A